jgi:hypothetical protein
MEQWWNDTDRGELLEGELPTASICPERIPHELVWVRIWEITMTVQQLTSCAKALFCLHKKVYCVHYMFTADILTGSDYVILVFNEI